MRTITNQDSLDTACRGIKRITSRLLMFVAVMSMIFQGSAIEVNADEYSSCSVFLEKVANADEAYLPSEGPGETTYNLFNSSSAKNAATELTQVTSGTVFDLNIAELTGLRAASPESFTLEVPMDKAPSIVLELYQVDILSDDFLISSDVNGDYSGIDVGVHYHGSVVGAEHSIVAVSVFEDELKAMFIDDVDSYNLGPVENGSQEYVCYKAQDLSESIKSQFGFSCSNTDDEVVSYTEDQLNYSSRAPGDIVKIFVEVDNSIYLTEGSSMASTISRMTSLFNQNAAIYAAESISTQVSEISVWTGADPYDGSGPGDIRDEYLAEFQGQYGVANGDLAILVIQEDIGGVAASYGAPNSGLCRSDYDESMCISGQSGTAVNTFPTYTYNTYIVSHELGHLFGSRHTHACVWNGNGTAIDGCAGGTEGGCALPPNPAPGAATVMSYCQAELGAGYIAAAPFGPQPGNVIRNNVAGASCLSASPASSSGCSLENLGFESGFSNWTTSPETSTSGSFAGQSNTEGSNMAIMETTFGAQISIANIEGSLGIPSGTFDALSSVGQSFTQGSYVTREVCLGEGDVVTFDWNFLTEEIPAPLEVVDASFVLLVEDGVILLAEALVSVVDQPTGNATYPDMTGWQAFSHTAASAGTSQLAFVVLDAVDDEHQSALLIDDVTIDCAFTLENCPDDIILGTDAGSCDAEVTWTPPNAIGGVAQCAGATVTSSHDPGDTFPVGTTQVTYVFSAPGEESLFCFFDVIISDDEDPVINCPGDITVSSDAGQCGANVNYSVTASDNCSVGTFDLIYGFGDGDFFPVGTTAVSWTVWDNNQNADNCVFNVTVNDTEAPTIISCPDSVELSFNLNCLENAPILPDYTGLPTFADNCGVTSISQSPAPGTVLSTIFPTPFMDEATITVSVIATDAAGNTMIPCMFPVTLNDFIGPSIACPGDQIVTSEEYGDGNCNISMPDFTGLAEAGVLCGTDAATVTQVPLIGTQYTKGDTITVTLTASDGNSNSSACQFDAIFVDDTAPVLVACGADPALETTLPGECTVDVALNAPTVSDNCTGVTIYGVRGDGVLPNITGPDYIGAFYPCETEVYWFAEDECGNVSDTLCSNTVEVREPISQLNEPFAACKEATRGLNNLGEALVCAIELADDAAGDACSDITVTMERVESLESPTPDVVDEECILFSCADVGLNYVIVQFEDCSGNKNYCKTIVFIEDNQDPFIACPGDIRIECDMDNDGDPLAFDPALPLPAHLPNYPQANVPVDLAALQAWIAAGYGIGTPSPGQDAANGITGLPLAYDNCGATISYENKYYLLSDVTFSNPVDYISDLPINDPHECDHHNYNIIRTWTIVDVNKGLEESCDQLIEVRDTTDPVIAPNGIVLATNVACDDQATIDALLALTPTATDNCYLASFDLVFDNSGAPQTFDPPLPVAGLCVTNRIQRVWIATDACGNSARLEQNIRLYDDVDPTLSVTVGGQTYTGIGPHLVTLDTDSLLCDRNTFFSVTADDNCDEILLDNYAFLFGGSPLQTSDIVYLNGTAEFNRVLEKGVTPFEVSVFDDCGNFAIVTFLITIEDNEDPVLECNDATETYFTSNADVITPDSPFNCTASIPLLLPPFMDNCPQGSGFLEARLNGGTWTTLPAGQIWSVQNLPLGTHTVEYRLTDDAGNTSEICSKDFIIEDDQDPVLVCPLSKTFFVGDDGVDDCQVDFTNGWLAGNFNLLTTIVPLLEDNCDYTATYTLTGATTGTGSFSVSYPPFFPINPAASAPGLDISFNLGNTSVVYSAMDAAGNTTQCSFSVTVIDNIDPTITCPPSIVGAVTDPGVCTYTTDVTPTIGDNCAVDYIEYNTLGATALTGTIQAADFPGILANFPFGVGLTYVTYRVYDTSGNSEFCQYTVEVADEELPVVACPNDYRVGTSGIIYINGTTGATLPEAQLDYTGSDCETTVAGLEVETTDNCCVSSVQYRILDASDNSIYQNWLAYENLPTPADADLTLDLSGQVFEKGEWIVELRAWDCHMNEGVCSFNVEVFDDEAPAFDYCPTDIVLNNVDGECSNNAGWVQPDIDDILDNCLPACPVTFEGPFVSFDNDNDLADIDPDITVLGGANAFALFPVGVRYIKYKATDDYGNTVFCKFSVTIVDNENPTIACPAPSPLTFDFDCDTLTLDDYRGLALVDDNCGIAVDLTTQSPAPGTLISDIPGITPNTGESFTVTIVTYDLSGNSDSCSFDITIEDNVGPTIACPANQIVYTGEGDTDCLVALADYTGAATAQVACGNEEPTVTQSPAPNTLITGPINIVTLTATDSQGNSTACSFNVGVVDNTAPTGICYADPDTVTAAIGECSADVLLRAPEVTDNCDATPSLRGERSDGEADIVALPGSFGSYEFSVYATTVTWIATDDAGNSTLICTNEVIVKEAVDEDNEPNAGCTDKTFGLKNSGTVTLCADDFGSATDDCVDPDELTLLLHVEGDPADPSECITFDCDDIGTFEICLIALDQSGNEDRCYSFVTIQDKRDPQMICPADITIACHTDNGGDPDPGVTVPFDMITPFSQVDFDAWNPYTDSGQSAANGITGAPLAMDNCGGTVDYNDASTQGSNPDSCDYYTYEIIRTWTATDNQGQTDECEQIITVKDTIAPFFVTGPNMLDRFINCDNPNAAAYLDAALALEPVADDLCYVRMELISDVTSDPYESCVSYLGGNNIFQQRTRTWRAEDACGNFVDYVQIISFQDFTAPALVCPNGGNTIDEVVDAGLCSVEIPLVATATDCQEVSFSYRVKDLSTGVNGPLVEGADATQSFAPGSYCIEFFAEDPCGNESSCQVFVNVADDQAPTLDCSVLADVTINTDPEQCSAIYAWVGPSEDDNCGATLLCEVIVDEVSQGIFAVPGGVELTSEFGIGETTVLYYAVDAAGNYSDSCSFVVTVVDDQAPFEIGPHFCPADVELNTSIDGIANYNCSAPYNWKAPELSDNCGVTSYECLITSGADTLSGPTQSFGGSSTTFQFPVGTSTVSYVASDAEGNTWTCSFDVTVVDDEAPIAICQDILVFLGEDGTASIAGDSNDSNPLTINNGSYDNCASFWFVSQSQFGCADLGVNTVILTIQDEAGHSTSCEASVTVIDPLLPTIECVADTTVNTSDDGTEGDCNYDAGTEFDPAIADNTALGDNARTIDGSGPWGGFMNVFETPANGGGFVFPSGWGVADVVALVDADDNTVTLKPNRINVPITDSFWFNPDGSGNKDMDGSVFIAANELLGQTFTYSGEVLSNDLDESYEAYAFIRVFNADFSVLLEERRADLVAGETFTVAYLNTQPDAGQIQYGFSIGGICFDPRPEADAAYDALGSVVIGATEACELTLTNDYNGEASLDGESFSATGSPYTINWTVEDAAGNTASCSTTITVLDDEAPAFTYCPADIEQDALTGNCLSLVSWEEPSLDDVTDNCGVAGIEGPFVSDPTVQIVPQSNGSAFGNFPIGTTTVSYIVSDIYANQTTCEFTVTVNDNQAPLIFDFEDYYEMPFDGLVCGATVNVAPPIAYDQCGTLTYHCDYTDSDSGMDVYPAGEDTEVTWTVTDEAGNSATATAIVRVGKLSPATNLRAVCRADKGFVKFKFDAADGAQRHQVQVRAAGGGDFLWTKLNYNADVTVAYMPMDTLPEGEYQWRVVSYCKMDDAENLPGWEEYSRRYTKWEVLDMPCSSSINLNEDENTADGKISELEIFSADIFPNPNNGTFNIRTDMEMYNLEIMDAEGKLVFSLDKVTEQFMEISLDDLNNGIYLVRMFNDGSMITKRITIQK